MQSSRYNRLGELHVLRYTTLQGLVLQFTVIIEHKCKMPLICFSYIRSYITEKHALKNVFYAMQSRQAHFEYSLDPRVSPSRSQSQQYVRSVSEYFSI